MFFEFDLRQILMFTSVFILYQKMSAFEDIFLYAKLILL